MPARANSGAAHPAMLLPANFGSFARPRDTPPQEASSAIIASARSTTAQTGCRKVSQSTEPAGLHLGPSYVTGLLRFGPGRDADGAWATLMWRQARRTIFGARVR